MEIEMLLIFELVSFRLAGLSADDSAAHTDAENFHAPTRGNKLRLHPDTIVF